VVLLLGLLWTSGHCASANHEVPTAGDLRREAGLAEQACVPLLLEFAAAGCEYCTLLEDAVLKPILLNRDYDTRVVMRKLLLDKNAIVVDFSGRHVTAASLATHYRVSLTPTLLFLDGTGDELTERMIGVTTLDFYGGYLDQALDASKRELQARGRCDRVLRHR